MKNSPLTNHDSVDDELKPEMIAQTPQWWVFSVVVTAMDKLKIVVAL